MIHNVLSADPGLCQGRGGAWDHRRCGTWLSGRKQRHKPSRQHLCQLHAPAIYMLLPNPHTPQTLPQASKATTLTATCPCHLFFRGFKTAVCPPSNPPNAPAGLQGNNSYSYMPLPSVFQGVQHCRLPALKPSKRFRRPPRQQLLQLHASAICFSGGSRLPFARPQTPQNAPAGLQGNNSYSYMPLPSVFQGVQDCRLPADVQDCRLPALKPPKRFRRPPRQQLLQLHAPAICFSGGSRLPFARPQTLQTLPQASKATTLTATCPCHLFFRGSRLPFARPQTPETLPHASKGTTLTATCPCHLFFRGFKTADCPRAFKTAVCPPSNPPNASAGLQGNNSYSYMPLPSVFQGVQDCRLPALKPPKRSRRPHAPTIYMLLPNPQTPQTLPQASKVTTLTATCPCHLFFRGFKIAVCSPSNPPNAPAGLQGNNSYSYMPLPSVFQGVQDCRLPALKPSKRFRRPPRQQLLQLHAPAICFSGGSRLPFARPQTPETLPQASKGTTLTATCPCHLFFRGFKTAVCPRTFKAAVCPPQTLPQASKATTLTATCRCHLFFRGFKTAVCPPSNPPNASAGLQGNNSYSYMPLPSVFHGVQDCRLPALKPPQTLPQASKGTTLTATCPCHLFFRGFKTAVCPRTFKTAVCPPSNPTNASAGLQGNNSYSYMPLPSVFQGVQDCRLPALKPPKRSRRPPTALKPPKRFRRPPRQQLLQLHVPAICLSGGSRLPFARPQTPQTLPQASKGTTLTATCPDICFSGGSRLPFARPQTLQTLPQASKATTLTATCLCHLFFRGLRLPFARPQTPPNAPAGLQGNNSYSYMPLPSVFQGVQDCRLPADVQDCRLPALKPPKRFRRPPRQQLLQLHAPAICFSRGSRLPFARPQTLQTLPQASKATTLTATCPCHLFFRWFKTAVCPPSNPRNAPAGLQGNNSYSYMPLPSVFQGVQDCRLPADVQDCRLPALKPPKRFRRPPRQQLLQLHARDICFSGGSRLPFARPQTPQTLPQASKATTLTGTCPCHLFFRGFKTAVCPASNTQTVPTLPQAFKATTLTATCPCHLLFSGSPETLPQASKATTLTATCPCPAFCFSGGSRLPFARPQTPKRLQPSRRPSRQQLLQLHVPAICFSGGSRLPLARPQTPQTIPQASKGTTLTATCPCHLFFRGFKTAVCPRTFKTAVCPPLNPPNASAGLQGNNSYSYMPLPSVFQGVQDCRLPALKPSRRFRRPPRQQLLRLHAPAICFSGVQDCRLPALKPPKRSRRPPREQLLQLHAPAICFSGGPPKRFRRPPRQQLLQLHASAICFSGGSRLPFARPQTPQTLPQASKATTLTATCPCHLFFRGPPKRFRRPPRQQLLQLHAPAIGFSGGSRLPFARPQTLQTLPQAFKATTLTATCPCHLFFRGFKTAVCPPSNPPNASAGLQGNNSYSYMPLPSVFQGVQDCRLPALKPPKRFRRPPRQQLLQLHVPALPSVFQGVQDCRLPGLKHPNGSNPPAGLQGNNSYSYMPVPSVFQGVRPPRQQLLQLHAPAICFSGGSRLPFARPQTPQTIPQASKGTTLATCPCHLFFRWFKTAVCPRTFKTAVCPPSNPPNASAGLQGNNSYSYMPLPSIFRVVQDCRLPALKPSKRFRRPPRQQLLQLHAPAICFSGGSRLPFARPQTPETLPQASKGTTLTATCPCHLFFRGFKTAVCPRTFKTAVCPPSNPPNASADLQGSNSYSYMPLPSVFQGVQDCRLPALKPPKRFRRVSRQQLLQLHAPAICFSRGSRLPFARPQTPHTLPQGFKATTLTATCPCHLFFRGFKTAVCPPSSGGSRLPFARGRSRLPFARPQTPQTLPQASKATTLTATCPCHQFFKGFKTAVCPPSNPPNASAGLQGNNSYSYMSLPCVFQGVQDCRLPALKPPKRFRRPPRQQLLQLHAPAICFSGGSRLPFARPQTPQTLPQGFKATTLTATCPCHLFFTGLPSVFHGVPDCRLPALKPPKRFRRPPRQQLLQLHVLPSVFQGVQDCRLPGLKPPNASNPPAGLQGNNSYSYMPLPSVFQGVPRNASAGLQGNNSYSYMPLPSVFQGVQDCRLPLKPPKRSRRPPRQQLLQLHAPAIQTLPTLPQAFKATTLTATCPCHLFFRGSGLQGNNSYSYMPLPSVFQGVQDCRLPALKPPKRSRRPPREQLLLHAPAICFSGGSRLPFAHGRSRLPFARPQTPQTLPQASKATTLTATCPCHLFFGGFKTAVCPPSNPPNAPAGLQGNNSCYMPLPSVFQGVQDCRLPTDVQDCRLPALKPPKRFRRPPRQQLLQLHAPAIYFSGGSRLPFARPQTLQTLPQASKATTLTATCRCHLFFRGFKTAVCPPSNPRNAPAGLQGNNSYSYMPLPSVFQGVQDCRLPADVQDCRLPALKPPKRFRRPPRQQLLQLHAPAICFSGGSRLPFARPQTPQTLPQGFKATTLTATCPCHLFFTGFQTAVCPPSNPPHTSAGLQGNNSYSYMPLPSVFQGVQDCRLPALFRGFKTAVCPRTFKTAVCPPSNPPNASAGLQGNNSYSYMPLPSVFQGVQDCRLPALKPSKRFRRPSRQQLLQLHVPAMCFSGGSRLPFARPQTPQTLPQASKATTLTATCPCHLFFRGFKTAVCPPSNPPNASAGFQGNNSHSYMPLPSVFHGVPDCRLPALKPPKRFRRPPRQQLLQLHVLPSVFQGVQDCRLPGLKPPNASNPPAGLQGNNSYSYMPLPSVFQGVPRNASAGLQGNNSYSYMPLPSVFQGVQDCRLPLKPPKRSRRPPRQQLLQLHAPAIQTLPTLPQAFKATTLTATCPCHLFFRGSPETLPQASKATTLTGTCPCHLFFRRFKTAVCPPSNPPKRSRRPPRQQLLQLHAPAICFSGGSRPLKPPKRFRTPPRQQLLQLHVPAICFSGGSRLPFARPQTPKRFQPSRRPSRQQLLQLHAPAICFSGSAWATRACDSPSLMGLLLWHEPFCFLAWFPSRRVMVDMNLPRRTA